MKFNLKQRPVKSTPQEYERFLKGLEKELREKDLQMLKKLIPDLEAELEDMKKAGLL